jgi:glycosyltransferase involved in cell wall biosynthesis
MVGKKKAIVLPIILLFVCVTALLIGMPSSLVILWGFLISGPLVLPRIILGLPYGRHKNIVKRVVNEKGPVLVVGGAGYLTPVGDVATLAAAMQHLLNDPELRQRMGQAGRQRAVERFSIEVAGKFYLEKYDELIEQRVR